MGLPRFPRKEVPTPFGSIFLPDYALEIPRPPKMTEPHREVIRQSVGAGLAHLIGYIPTPITWAVAEAIQDMHGAARWKSMSPKEQADFLKYNKVEPDILAALHAISK